MQILKVKMICFDFDGTIANTMPWLEHNAIQLFVEHYNIVKEKAIQEYRSTTGLPFEHQVEIIFPNHKNNKLVIESFEYRKMERMDEQELFPETKDVLRKIKEKGYLTAVSSSTTKPIIEEYVKKKKIIKFLDDIVGFYPGFEKGKHHFDYLMEKFKLEKEELVYVGDSLKDMERAFNAGIKFYGRLGPMFSAQDFFIEKNGQKSYFKTITSLEQLLAHLEE